MVTELKTILNYRLLNITEISKIIGVSRPTIYAWIDGKEPCLANFLKLYLLADNLKTINDANIPRINRLIRRPLFDGLSMLDILENCDGIPKDYIARLKNIAIAEELARKKQKGFDKMAATVNFNTAVYMCDY